MTTNDNSSELQTLVKEAYQQGTLLNIVGNQSKSFYAYPKQGKTLEVFKHAGIVSYEPSELCIVVRAGTTLAEIETVLADKGQMLAFEPPYYGDKATIGGTIACGFSGPRRPYMGSARDFILGVSCLNGKGEKLTFGGQVIKNVAGYDVSRLMVGALGTLGVLLDISLKVLPKPAYEMTWVLEKDLTAAISLMNHWAGKAIPLSAMVSIEGKIYVRLSGTELGVKAALAEIGGENLTSGKQFWQSIREHQHDFFQSPQTLWRLSVPPATPPLPLVGDYLLDWGGAQRWLKTNESAAHIREVVATTQGHATCFRNGGSEIALFHPLPPILNSLHQRIKKAFDPKLILNYPTVF